MLKIHKGQLNDEKAFINLSLAIYIWYLWLSSGSLSDAKYKCDINNRRGNLISDKLQTKSTMSRICYTNIYAIIFNYNFVSHVMCPKLINFILVPFRLLKFRQRILKLKQHWDGQTSDLTFLLSISVITVTY